MAYTPNLSQHHSATLRRIAWSLGSPMTTTMEEIFDYLGSTLDPNKLCSACRDKSKCLSCPFNRKGSSHAKNS